MSHNFLIEIGTEELPPTSLLSLSKAFSSGIISGLKSEKIAFEKSSSFATPRRLALYVEGLEESTPIVENKNWGPPVKVAFDQDGNPTKAAEAFAKKNNLAIDELRTESDGKQEKLVCTVSSGGEKTRSLLNLFIQDSLKKLPIKKRMRWGESRVEFVRPVQWVLSIIDSEVLDGEFLGCKSSNTTRGHRFHVNKEIQIDDPAKYEDILQTKGRVIASFEKRQNLIKQQVNDCASKLKGQAVISTDLLDEVTALVEWPVALSGRFDKEFLSVPQEALVSSMKEHQKYFHVVDNKKSLLPCFVTVSNIESKDHAKVIDGNERVIRPRLADAAFFFETDKKHSLHTRREKLKTVLFQKQLGSIYDKTERIKLLANHLAAELGVNIDDVCRTAELCKSDLVSSMVYEFPEMQGIAGYHYALNDKENESVALAIVEQYLPKFSGDKIPLSDVGRLIALTDRIDTVTGIFGIGEKPTGSKDPYGLRRSSLAILRIMVESKYDMDLRPLIELAAKNFQNVLTSKTTVDDVVDYCIDRFKALYQERGVATEEFLSVEAKKLSNPFDIDKRVNAVSEFIGLPEALPLAEANKRVSNILAKSSDHTIGKVDENLLQITDEKQLYRSLLEAKQVFYPLVKKGDYTAALSSLASLKEPVDAFFDNVMVMVDDQALKNNRLALLQELRGVFLEIADISCLVVKS